MTHLKRPSAPYVGLSPYSEKDVAFFFGREVDTEVVTSNLRASKLTLVYGGSGVGKSSLLNAGVAHQLRTISESTAQKKGGPEFIVAIFRDWMDDPVAGLSLCVREAVARAMPELAQISIPPTRNLSQMLANWLSLTHATLFIILDQFEEYLLRPETSVGEGSFAFEFPRAVARTDPAVKFVLSMRDDAVARLDFFKASIPGIFDNRLEIKPLDREAAERAIRKPIDKYNELCGTSFEIEDELVEQVLNDVEVANVRSAYGGQARAGEAEQSRIETPYLQLVMSRIWERERELGSTRLRLVTLTTDLGGSQKIVDTHLDDAMNALPLKHRKLAARFVHFTVTRYGTKVAADAATLAEWAELPRRESQIRDIFERLSTGRARIYRGVSLRQGFGLSPEKASVGCEFFEVYHDALIPALLSWRRRFVEAREKRLTEFTIKREELAKRRQLLVEEKEKRRRLIEKQSRRRKLVAIVASAILLFAILITYILVERNAAGQVKEAQNHFAVLLHYSTSLLEIREYLESKNSKTRNVALNRLEGMADENVLTIRHHKLFQQALEGLPEEDSLRKDQVLAALQKSKPRTEPLPGAGSLVLLRIYYQDTPGQEAAERVKDYLENKNRHIFVMETEYVGYVDGINVPRTQLRYFFPGDQAKTEQVVAYLSAAGIKTEGTYIPKSAPNATPGQLELWFPSTSGPQIDHH